MSFMFLRMTAKLIRINKVKCSDNKFLLLTVTFYPIPKILQMQFSPRPPNRYTRKVSEVFLQSSKYKPMKTRVGGVYVPRKSLLI